MMAFLLIIQLFLIPIIWQRSHPLIGNKLLDFSLWEAINLCLISLIYFWCKLAEIPFGVGITLLIVFGISHIVYIHRVRNLSLHDLYKPLTISLDDYRNMSNFSLFAIALFGIGLGIFVYYHDNFGGWDAIAVWNLKAQFLLSATDWLNIFSPEIYWSHPDYPLMLPSLVASGWDVFGGVYPFIPAFIQLVLLALICLILFSGLRQKKHSSLAVIAVAIICLDRHFIARVVSEYADTLLSLYYLLGVIVLLFWNKISKSKQFFWIGLLMSACFWSKNEGMVFFIIWSLVCLFRMRKNLVSISYFTLGVSPTLISFLYLKIILAPQNVIIKTQTTSSIIDKISDTNRYIDIVQSLSLTLAQFYPVILLLLIFGIYNFVKYQQKIHWSIALVIVGTLVTYVIAYLLTPYDLEWHLQHSVLRLLHQLYPATILALMMYLPAYQGTSPGKTAAKSS